MGKVIAVVDNSGDINSALLAVNLSIALAVQSKRGTALIDLSLSSVNEIGIILNFKPIKFISDILPFLDGIDEKFFKGYLSYHNSGINVLGGIESGKKQFINPQHFKKIIQLISGIYENIIVITPEEYNEYLAAIIDVSDSILLTVTPNLLSMERAKSFLDELKSAHFPLSLIKLVLIKMKNLQYSIKKEDVDKYLSLPIFSEIFYEPDVITTSINSGNPAVLSEQYSSFSKDINNLAAQIYMIKENIDRKEKQIYETSENINKTNFKELKEKIHENLIAEIGLKNIDLKDISIKNKIRKEIDELISKEAIDFSRDERSRLAEELLNDVLGFGCLEEYLTDPDITEIMVNGPDAVYVEKAGKIKLTNSKFSSQTQLLTVIDRIVSPLGRHVDELSPLVDARLPDGSRVNVIIPPISLVGPSITIRKFSKDKLTSDDLIRFGALSNSMAEFLKICIQLRKNIIISGGTGSGKTTLLNVIASFISKDERIVTIEDSAELNLPQEHIVRLESRRPSVEGTGEVSIRQLVINALRMRPDRIIVGECRSGETLDMLQAMNTGHDGSLTTIHANTPKDAITRISTMVIMAGTELPEKAIREQIGSAIDVIVQLTRLSDGSRKIIDISEVKGIKNDTVELSAIFQFEQKAIKDGKVVGEFHTVGNVPSFMDEIQTHGLSFDENIFS